MTRSPPFADSAELHAAHPAAPQQIEDEEVQLASTTLSLELGKAGITSRPALPFHELKEDHDEEHGCGRTGFVPDFSPDFLLSRCFYGASFYS